MALPVLASRGRWRWFWWWDVTGCGSSWSESYIWFAHNPSTNPYRTLNSRIFWDDHGAQPAMPPKVGKTGIEMRSPSARLGCVPSSAGEACVDLCPNGAAHTSLGQRPRKGARMKSSLFSPFGLAGFQPAKPSGKKREAGSVGGLTLGVPRRARWPKAGMGMPFQGADRAKRRAPSPASGGRAIRLVRWGRSRVSGFRPRLRGRRRARSCFCAPKEPDRLRRRRRTERNCRLGIFVGCG